MTSAGGPSRYSEAVSAGGVVYREDGGALEVAICGRVATGLWALPKGTPDRGETIEQTAVREVSEETGLEVAIEEPLGHIEYVFERNVERIFKRVYFFLMSRKGGSFDLHDPEFDVVEWAGADRALRTLTHETEREVVRRAIDAIARREAADG